MAMMEVETRQYEFSHGKKARGRGNWAFFFDGRTAVDDAFWHNGSFAEACKLARAYARAKGFHRVEVGS